jgi:hypothetical protein
MGPPVWLVTDDPPLPAAERCRPSRAATAWRLPEPGMVALVSCVGTLGGGCERGTMELAQILGEQAVVVTSHASGWAKHRRHEGIPFVRPEALQRALTGAACVVDEGTAQLGGKVPFEGRFVRAVRCCNRVMTRALGEGHSGPTVYAGDALAARYVDLIQPGDAVIPNGVVAATQVPEKEPGLTVLHARLSWQRAIGGLLEQNPRLGRVVVCGDGPQRAELAQRFPEVEFVGHVDPEEWLARAEVNLHWSLYQVEGWWRGPMEGLAHGCAVVANANGDLPYLSDGSTVTMAADLAEAGRAWRRLLSDRGMLAEVQEAGLRLAAFQPSAAVSLQRWKWLVQRECGQAPAIPETLVAVTYGSGPARRAGLDLCLQALARQTAPTRVVVLNDVATPLRRDPDLRDWLAERHPDVLVHDVTYDAERGSNPSLVRNAIWQVAAGEPIWWWLDCDVVVAEDAVERIAAQMAVDPAVAPCFPRQRIAAGPLPAPLLEPVMRAQMTQVPEPRPSRRRTRQSLGHNAAWFEPRRAFGLAAGPARAIWSDLAFAYNEALVGYGGDDNWWSCEAILRRGLQPRLGPTAFHVEHEPVGARAHGWEPPVSAARNRDLIFRGYGLE